jgi:hypothetical protein
LIQILIHTIQTITCDSLGIWQSFFFGLIHNKRRTKLTVPKSQDKEKLQPNSSPSIVTDQKLPTTIEKSNLRAMNQADGGWRRRREAHEGGGRHTKADGSLGLCFWVSQIRDFWVSKIQRAEEGLAYSLIYFNFMRFFFTMHTYFIKFFIVFSNG